jgi:uncharacterized protein (UPF0264 family)
MTGLLISVRGAAEAQLALAGGADIVDIKEPALGSLGRADAATVGDVRTLVQGRVPTSVALGELSEALARDFAYVAGCAYAKLGLAGCGPWPDWPERWAEQIRRLPPSVASVAVVYADWRAAAAPPPDAVLARGGELKCSAVLVDTYDKSHGDLLTYFDRDALRAFLAAARQQRMLTVLGGSLGLASLAQVLPFTPDYIAVRGSACIGSRNGSLDSARVRDLADRVHGGA